MTEGRRAASEILAAVRRGRRLDRAFADIEFLDSRDRKWCRRLVFGIERFRGRLDHLLDRKVRRGLASLDVHVRDVLRIGVYEVLYMDSVPDYAVVSQAVELARSLAGPGVGRLVNAVLRAVAKEGGGEEHFPDPAADPAGYLSTWGSHPRWLVERWLARWSFVEVRDLIEGNNCVPPTHLRCLWDTPEHARDVLATRGIEAEIVGSGTECVVLHEYASLVESLEVIPSVVQDPAAALVVQYSNPAPDARVADLCAAPGGKAIALGAKGNMVLAADASLRRLRLVRENVRRAQEMAGEGRHLRVYTAQADARSPAVGEVDMVFLDVPCTGTGTLRRSPDVRWKVTPARLAALTALQERILHVCAEAVPKGGILVYSTCSLEPEENEDQIDAFLRKHPDFRVEAGSGVDERYLDGLGQLYVLPQSFGFDGTFAARLRRSR